MCNLFKWALCLMVRLTLWTCANFARLQIDGIVLNGAHFGYYHAGNVPSSINETIVLHHHQPANQIPQPQEVIIERH